MTSVYTKRGHFGTDLHREKTPGEDEGRDHGGTSTNQGIPEISSKLPEARGEAWDRFFLTFLGRSHTCQHLDLRFFTSRNVRQ